MKKKRGDNRLKKVDKGEIGSMKKRKMVNKIFCNKGKRRREPHKVLKDTVKRIIKKTQHFDDKAPKCKKVECIFFKLKIKFIKFIFLV